jgi:hypothetical protein
MKIVNREDFLKLRAGTLYSKYELCNFGDLLIKGGSLENDWCFQQIADAIEAGDTGEFVDSLAKAKETGESVKMDFDCMGRDGMFEEDQLFAVWEDADVRGLIKRLEETIM